MTRGTLYLILADKAYHSTEFNGDMYGSPKDSKDLQKTGHYLEVIKRLKRVKDKESFKKEIVEFNAKNHNYKEKLMWWFKNPTGRNLSFDLSKDYYETYFSDYLYFKNCSGSEVRFIEKESKKEILLSHNEIATFNFGELIEVIKN